MAAGRRAKLQLHSLKSIGVSQNISPCIHVVFQKQHVVVASVAVAAATAAAAAALSSPTLSLSSSLLVMTHIYHHP